MCGIAGILGEYGAGLPAQLDAMVGTLVHRGPDASGTWADPAAGIGMAHRRLAILDLSPQGAQPMVSENGRHVICYNGEIYNHLEVRRSLEATGTVAWRGHSDTEVLLEAIARWGVRSAIERSNGMFAFAVWDREERRLTLARDRLGEKPLYVGRVGSNLVFASELKALRTLPGWRHSVDRRALGFLLRFGYIPAPLSIHPHIFKLPPATLVQFASRTAIASLDLQQFMTCCERYWKLAEVATSGIAQAFPDEGSEAADALDTLLTRVVAARMEADVPVGALLSGGIDSSLVTALMQKVAPRPVRTFTIGFREGRFDEAPYARRIAAHLGTDHTELQLTPDDALALVPRLPTIYDEPFADPSQLPTVLVSQIARRQVTVALSGDGGDELFCGYARYTDALRVWRWIGDWSPGSRSRLAMIFEYCGRMTASRGDALRLGSRLRRFGHRIAAADFDCYYANLLSLAPTATSVGGWSAGLLGAPVLAGIPVPLTDPTARMMFIDQFLYLPENILTKVDRASMSASLELRVPLLDPDILSFSWRLPRGLRHNGRVGKVLLRRILYRYVSAELLERPKQGFEIPLDAWLRGPLREWMVDLLDPVRLRGDGYLDAAVVTRHASEHLAGRADHGYLLWPALIFAAWQRCNV